MSTETPPPIEWQIDAARYYVIREEHYASKPPGDGEPDSWAKTNVLIALAIVDSLCELTILRQRFSEAEKTVEGQRRQLRSLNQAVAALRAAADAAEAEGR